MDAMNTVKKEKQAVEDHLFIEQTRARQINDSLEQLKLRLKDAITSKEEADRRSKDYESLKI